MMTGFGMGFVFMALFWIVIIGGGIWLLGNLFPKNNGLQSRPSDNESALDILKQRYARGELTKEEYESIRCDLEK